MKYAFFALLFLAGGCVGASKTFSSVAPEELPIILAQVGSNKPGEPLPMRIPIKGVMAGIIDFSAHGVFTTATSEVPLTEDDWLAAGLASINLIGSATLITSHGPGPNDAIWVADPEWQFWAKAFQKASVDAAMAIKDKNRPDFLRAANDLANACQSCHDRFRITDQRPASEFAMATSRGNLGGYLRAWPAPETSAQ